MPQDVRDWNGDGLRYGLYLPTYGDYADIRTLVEMATEAEAAGWDGFFIWDIMVIGSPDPVADSWVALSAIATQTERIALGPMVTPLARRRPWTVCRQAVSLDHLSDGRFIMGVGLGGRHPTFEYRGKPADLSGQAALLDESLAVLVGLWEGRPFDFEGQYYQVRSAHFAPTPVQTPRIPIWVAGIWPNKAPFRRAARWEGVFPLAKGVSYLTEMMPVEQITEVVTYVQAQREDNGRFDIVHLGLTPGNDLTQAAAIVHPYQKAGITWWLENINDERFPNLTDAYERIRQGPPKMKSM